jgi:hypothetical protein
VAGVAPVPVLSSPRAGWRVGLVAAALVVLAGCGTGTLAGSALAHLLFPQGPQTATIRVTVGSPAPNFSGSIAGEALNGVSSAGNPTLAAKLCPGMPVSGPDAAVFTYSGTYDGQSYSFSGCTAVKGIYGKGSSSTIAGIPGVTARDPVGMEIVFKVQGHIGSAAIVGSADWDLSDSHMICQSLLQNCTWSFPFSGTVGSQKLSGTATADDVNMANLSHFVLSAHLTVG